MEKKITSRIIDEENGEILKNIYEGDTCKIITKEEKEFWKTHVKMEKSQNFISLDSDIIDKIKDCKLTPGAYHVFWVIVNHLGYYEQNGEVIKKSGVNSRERLNATSLKKICNIPSATFNRAINELVKHEIIFKEEDGRNILFLANPFIFCSGRIVLKKIRDLFEESKWNPLKK